MESIVEIIEKFDLISLIYILSPILVAGFCTMLIVHVIRLDNRQRFNPPMYPLDIVKYLVLAGIPLGMFFQWAMEEIVMFFVKDYHLSGLKYYMLAGVSAPFTAWGIHRLLVVYSRKRRPEWYTYWTVKHIPGVHNTDIDGDGVPDNLNGDATLYDKENEEK